MTTLLFLAGSTRKESFNKKLTQYAAHLATEHDGINAEFIDLLDYAMPIYNGDDEAANGLPEAAIRLKQRFVAADGFFYCIA